MEQLILHGLGDYVLQTQWMADNKAKSHYAAGVHAMVYSLPFFLLDISVEAFLVIVTTHFFIDRFRLARYVCFAKNWITDTKLNWNDCSDTGYAKTVPIWMSVWLMIICDNIIHLSINYLAIKFL